MSQDDEPKVDSALKAKVARLMAAFPDRHGDADKPVPDDDLDVRRTEVARTAWTDSLTAGEVTDLAGWRLEDLHPDQNGPALAKFVAALGPTASVRSLVFAGKVGPGKTSAAIAAGWAAIDRGLGVRFVEHSKYLLWLRPESSPGDGPYRGVTGNQLRARMRSCDLLIVDDLGASLDPRQPVSQHVKDETLTLIGDRIDTPGRATIVTTNLRSEHLAAMFGDQFLSRLSKRGHVLAFNGPDRRGKRLSF